jgi:hypothetical protein
MQPNTKMELASRTDIMPTPIHVNDKSINKTNQSNEQIRMVPKPIHVRDKSINKTNQSNDTLILSFYFRFGVGGKTKKDVGKFMGFARFLFAAIPHQTSSRRHAEDHA